MVKLAFDIGANKGQSIQSLLLDYHSIVSVDPISSHLEIIKIVYKNELHENRLKIVEAAVSSKSGTKIPIYEHDTITTAEIDWVKSSRFSNSHTWKPPVLVETTTIDELVENFGCPHFIKIDVEGHELEVLSGMSRAYSELLAFEWAEEMMDKAVQCIDRLKELRYIKFDICEMNDSLSFTPQWKLYDETIKKLKNNYTGNKASWGMIWASLT